MALLHRLRIGPVEGHLFWSPSALEYVRLDLYREGDGGGGREGKGLLKAQNSHA